MNARLLRLSAIAAAIATALPGAALGAEDTAALRKEIEQLKKELAQLRAVVQQQGQKTATKDEVKAVQTEVTRVAKEQSSVAGVNSLAHLAGYGAVGYTDRRSGTRSFDLANFTPIFHYQYKDLLFFEAELETNLQPDGTTEVGIEYANFNLFATDYLTVFGGKFLSPVGYFFQNLHPAWVNKFASRPPGFGGEGSAAPMSDVGIGLRGGFPLGTTARANYALYVGNGPRLMLNGAGNEIEAIEAEGASRNPANSRFIGGRLGLRPLPGLEFGISGGTARVAVEPPGGPVEANRGYSTAGADFAFKLRNLDLRSEYIQQRVGDLAGSVAPEGGTWKTWYAQAAYRLAPTKWEPVIRYGDFKSPHADQKLRQWGIGLNYWFAPSAVGKIGYEFNRGQAGTANDSNRLLLQFAYGF